MYMVIGKGSENKCEKSNCCSVTCIEASLTADA